MIELAIERDGPKVGTPLVVLHGFTGSGAAMRSIVEPLCQHREVIAVDLIGHGSSPSPLPIAAYEMSQVVEQVVAALDAEQVDLFGYSMGGRVALSIAVANQKHIRRLALLGASPGIDDDADRAERLRRDEALADSIEADGLPAFVESWMALPMFASLAGLGEEWLDQSRTQRLGNDPVGLANSLRGTGTGAMPPLHHALAGLDLPVLLLAGALDDKYSAVGRSMAEELPNGIFRPIAGAGHAGHLERPRECATLLAEFLDER